MGGFTPVIDENTGEITGYTTTIGGADTVFPFSTDYSDTPGTATPDTITQGYTAWVNGKLITGTRVPPSKYQSGYYVTDYLAYGEAKTYRINFPKAFVSTPAVTVSSDNSNIRMSVSGTPDTYGFYVYCINQGNGSRYQAGCTWRANGTVAE